MPNRIIKESIRTSRKLNALSDFQFRLWAYLVTYVDDYGRGSADPQLLKGFVFPRREVSLEEISAAMERLEQAGCILRYQAQDEWFFCFPHWSDHQRVQTKRSKFPPPPQEDTVGHGGPPPESESESKSVSLSESGSGFESKGEPPGGQEAAPSLPLNDQSEFLISQELMGQWQKEFPQVDVPAQLERMRRWLLDNPQRRKSRQGAIPFVLRWLKSERDSPSAPKSRRPAPSFDLEAFDQDSLRLPLLPPAGG